MRRLALSSSIALAAALSTARAAHASPQDLFGFGAHSSGMAATGPASAEGYEAVYGAPGLLAETRKQSITLGVAVARFGLSVTNQGQTQSIPADDMKTLYIGAALPIPFGGFLKDRVTFGLGFFDPVDFLVRGKILYPERYQFPIVAPRVQSLAIVLGLGVRVGDRLYVGAGYEALAAVVGQITLSLDPLGHVGARSDDQVIAAYAPIASLTYDVTDHVRVGATYRGELIGRFVITIHAQDLGIALPDFNVAGIAQYDPMQVAAEVRWSSLSAFGPNGEHQGGAVDAHKAAWRVSLGAVARAWAKWPGDVEPTVLANTNFAPPSPHAHDTISPRIAVERAFPISDRGGLRVRAGYALEPSPLPAQTKAVQAGETTGSTTNLFDSTRHVFTLGLGIVLDDRLPLQLDTFFQYHLMQSRTHVKDPDVPQDALGWPSVTSRGSIVVVGMTAGVRF